MRHVRHANHSKHPYNKDCFTGSCEAENSSMISAETPSSRVNDTSAFHKAKTLISREDLV